MTFPKSPERERGTCRLITSRNRIHNRRRPTDAAFCGSSERSIDFPARTSTFWGFPPSGVSLSWFVKLRFQGKGWVSPPLTGVLGPRFSLDQPQNPSEGTVWMCWPGPPWALLPSGASRRQCLRLACLFTLLLPCFLRKWTPGKAAKETGS